jgi:hypothetical protein
VETELAEFARVEHHVIVMAEDEVSEWPGSDAGIGHRPQAVALGDRVPNGALPAM